MNCWILTTPRSGSQYLSSILNNICEKKAFYEKLHPTQKITYKKFEENKDKFSTLIVHPLQYLFTFGERQFNTIPDPKTKLIYLYREDIIEKTISLYCAKKTNVWVITNNHLQPHQIQCDPKRCRINPIKIDEKQLISCYLDVKKQHNFWDAKIKDMEVLKISYNELIQNTKNEINKILNYLNMNSSNLTIYTDVEKMENNIDKNECRKIIKKYEFYTGLI